jgi:hypothetical protein
LNLGLGYELTRNMDGSVSYSFTQNQSSADSRDYTKNLIMLSLAIKF